MIRTLIRHSHFIKGMDPSANLPIRMQCFKEVCTYDVMSSLSFQHVNGLCTFQSEIVMLFV